MQVSELIQELQRELDEHGDLPVTLATMPHEYSISSVGYAEQGPLLNLRGVQRQNPPERIVLEAKDNLPALED